ncbi:MAG: hypothetical protein ACI3VA_12245, partial [Candidatus Limivicinus sp.]
PPSSEGGFGAMQNRNTPENSNLSIRLVPYHHITGQNRRTATVAQTTTVAVNSLAILMSNEDPTLSS